jgi:hypothetical protein
LIALLVPAWGQRITTPKEQFGNNIGDDYFLANYTQLTAYWQKLAKESNRAKLVSIGKTAEGREQWMMILTSPENHKRLDRYKEIARKLALAEGLTDDEARKLAAEGKAVVWIDGGLHATEVLGAHQLMEFVYQMLSMNDPETMRFLNDVIVLAVHANPDGMELVSNHYMREKEPTRRSTGGIPLLYQKYIGHDNNRDFYMSNMPESTNMNRQLYHEWFPQIMYNHHQTGPAGTVIFMPPFRDPFNYFFDPLIPIGLNLVGAAMHGRMAAEGKAGTTMLEGASYSTWFNGGLRTTTYFHNMIGLLTEAIGNPTPIEIPFVPNRLIANKTLPFPIQPQRWHFRQSIEYEMTANRAVVDVAARFRETFLFNIYRMGKNSIERGSKDNWTMTPKRLASVQAAIAKETGRGGAEDAPTGDVEPGPGGGGGGGGRGARIPAKFYEMTRDPSLRDPRGYIITANQPDFLTATKFMNVLIKTGITIHRATAEFEVAGKKYPAGSYVVKCAQAFRPHILDMFEPQDHPNDFRYPGGPPIPPYDLTGWTVAYQMGVQFDRILDGFDGPFEKITGEIKTPAGRVTRTGTPTGFTFSHQQNDSFIAVNRLLKNGDEVYWLKDGKGTMYVQARPQTAPVLERSAADLGVSFTGVSSKPSGDALKLKPVRIGLWDRYGGSMPSGWVRWMFEQYEFPFQQVFPQELDAGNLKSKFDVLVFVTGGIPGTGRGAGFGGGGRGGGGGGGGRGGGEDRIDPEFRDRTGNITRERTIPKLKEFVESGGTILTIGSSTALAQHLGLPVGNALIERTPAGERPLGRDKFYIPGSVVSMRVDNTHPLAWGMPDRADFMFDSSPAFRLQPEATVKGLKSVAWFDSRTPLRSGWAWGEHYLEGAAGVIEAPVGEGKLLLFGPEVTFRGQPHGTFKLLFNGIYYGPAKWEKM